MQASENVSIGEDAFISRSLAQYRSWPRADCSRSTRSLASDFGNVRICYPHPGIQSSRAAAALRIHTKPT